MKRNVIGIVLFMVAVVGLVCGFLKHRTKEV